MTFFRRSGKRRQNRRGPDYPYTFTLTAHLGSARQRYREPGVVQIPVMDGSLSDFDRSGNQDPFSGVCIEADRWTFFRFQSDDHPFGEGRPNNGERNQPATIISRSAARDA